MKTNLLLIMLTLFLLMTNQGFAAGHVQKDGLFSMNIPETWHWNEFPGEIIIAYPDGKTAAIDIQWTPVASLSSSDMNQRIKDNNDFLVKQIQAHGGTLTNQKLLKMDGIVASELDFNTGQGADTIAVSYVSFFNKGEGFKITYAARDVKTREVLDDVVASLKF